MQPGSKDRLPVDRGEQFLRNCRYCQNSYLSTTNDLKRQGLRILLTAGRAVRYAGMMRYHDGGGLTTAERARREQVHSSTMQVTVATQR
jgi:hypothetical protein